MHHKRMELPTSLILHKPQRLSNKHFGYSFSASWGELLITTNSELQR